MCECKIDCKYICFSDIIFEKGKIAVCLFLYYCIIKDDCIDVFYNIIEK